MDWNKFQFEWFIRYCFNGILVHCRLLRIKDKKNNIRSSIRIELAFTRCKTMKWKLWYREHSYWAMNMLHAIKCYGGKKKSECAIQSKISETEMKRCLHTHIHIHTYIETTMDCTSTYKRNLPLPNKFEWLSLLNIGVRPTDIYMNIYLY